MTLDIGASIQSVVEQLKDGTQQLNQLQFDEDEPIRLGAPAAPQELARLATLLGTALPPSYAAFMKQHNGWTDFEGDLAILSSADYDAHWVTARIAEWGGLFEENAGANPLATWAFPVLLGETSGRVVVLDRRSCSPDGELAVVAFDFTAEEGRYDSFGEFLRHELSVLRETISDLKDGDSGPME